MVTVGFFLLLEAIASSLKVYNWLLALKVRLNMVSNASHHVSGSQSSETVESIRACSELSESRVVLPSTVAEMESKPTLRTLLTSAANVNGTVFGT